MAAFSGTESFHTIFRGAVSQGNGDQIGPRWGRGVMRPSRARQLLGSGRGQRLSSQTEHQGRLILDQRIGRLGRFGMGGGDTAGYHDHREVQEGGRGAI